jgi:hypothetical protein
MKSVRLELTPAQAETVQTALLHTRREFLGLKERELLHKLVTQLSPYERELSVQGMHRRDRVEVLRQQLSAH